MASPRFVAFDCETTGTDPEKDAIITIGAVAVQDDEIILGDSFDALLQVPFATPAVVVHGITPTETAKGLLAEKAIPRFLDFVADAVLVGHHVGFDKRIVDRVAREHVNRSLQNPALDTMRMALALEEAGQFRDDPIERFDLDSLCRRFDVVPHDRHTASGDAYITAQIFLQLLRLCRKAGLHWEDLIEKTPG